MKRKNQITGKILYSLVFLVLIPSALWFWAKYTEEIIALPAIQSDIAGIVFMCSGVVLMLWGMFALQYYGKGLPMNAYPPPIFVTQGPYRIFRHPIYWGFGILLLGYFLFTGSASGIWMVLPVTILGLVALVLGYESIDLKRRFPEESIRSILDYPDNKNENAKLRDKVISLFRVGTYLFVCNLMIDKMNGAESPLFGGPLQILPALKNSYLSILSIAFVILGFLLLKKKESCRKWEMSGFIGLSWLAFFAFLFPQFGAQYLPVQGLAVLVVPLFLIFISVWTLFRESKAIASIFAIVGLILVVIQSINSKSAILHLVTSILIFLLSVYNFRIWIFLKNTSEKIANSWQEWIIGKVRIINHGIYVGTGALLGILLAGILAGKVYAIGLLVFSVIVTITSALWAQIIEGSTKLKRPFGYYGGLVGIAFGSLAIWAMGLNVWVIIGVASVIMPWVQAMGRLRCLVNGCCHGSKIDNPHIGIRYFHHRSRVCNISHLKGELLHPTQLYSILWLFFLGFVLLVLWNHSVAASFIFGIYLILTGIGRFVEEAYRGEAQTPNVNGLHLYQWTAIISVVVGIVMTLIKIDPIMVTPGFSWETVGVAILCGLFVFFAMGVDFPYSNARFSRLV